MSAIAALAFISTAADCASARISRPAGNELAVKIAVFSDDPLKFRDPRFTVTADDQLNMLSPIGHATTMDPILLENPDDSVSNDYKRYGVASGTIFMVSPCIALTNYHVVFGRSLEQPGASQKEYKVKVSIGGYTGVGVPFAWGDYSLGPENDWAAVRVTPCLGSSVGWLPIAYTEQQLPREVSIFGFYSDQDYSVLAGQNCVLIERSFSTKVWKTNCAMTHGTSGSPLGFFKQGNFQATAMAFASVLHKTSTITYDPQDANFAIDLFALFQNAPGLAVTIADELKAYSIPNPAQLLPGQKPKKMAPPPQPVLLAPTVPQNGLPPDPRPIALPPDPRPIALPPDPRPIALPPDPRPIEQPPSPAQAAP